MPATLELSQSGRGAHVWVLFTDKIPAAVARSIGTALIRDAMVLRGSPHDDQWRFLSALDRLSPADAQRIARQAKRAVVGNDVATMSRSGATRVHPPLPPLVCGTRCRAAPARLSPHPGGTVDVQDAASMANPKFYELQRLRKSTWDRRQFIRGYDITIDEHLILPRGLSHAVPQIVKRAGSRLAVTDAIRSGQREQQRKFDLTWIASAADALHQFRLNLDHLLKIRRR